MSRAGEPLCSGSLPTRARSSQFQQAVTCVCTSETLDQTEFCGFRRGLFIAARMTFDRVRRVRSTRKLVGPAAVVSS
jgi:hypothetical protein